MPVARRSGSRSVRSSAALIAVAAIALGVVAADAQSGGIPLPSRADVAALPPDPLTLLGGADPLETITRVPGRLDDLETVHVSMSPGGAPLGVVVEQSLTLHGTGDFAFSVQGPATHVEGPADAPVQPGLRRGRVIWQGFSPGERKLDARATLDMRFEAHRLPLRVSVTAPPDGASGDAEIVIAVSNATARPVPVTGGVPERSALGDALDAIRSSLAQGRAPVAGERGVPSSLPGAPGERGDVAIAVPFAFQGSITFASGTLDAPRVSGARPLAPLTGEAVRFAGRVDGASVVRIAGTARSAGGMRVALRARAVLPEPSSVTPRAGATWRAALASASGDDVRNALSTAQRALWQALRLPEYQVHLGRPGTGASQTTFVYETAAGVANRSSQPVRPRALGITLALVALAGAVANAAVLWARS